MLFQSPPPMFGAFHILWLIVILIFNVVFYFLIKNKPEDKLIKIIHLLGVFMIFAEVWKQWFVRKYVYPGDFSMWFFPWQLCSMAMYCSFVLPYLKEKTQNVVLVFMSTFSLFAAVIALLIPSDMLRPQLIFASHGFLYHGIMITESILSIIIVRKRERVKFYPASLLFLGMAGFAEVINVASHLIINNRSLEPNMFYITPYYETTQVVLNSIARTLGIFPEIIIYLSGIIFISYLIYLPIRSINKKEEV